MAYAAILFPMRLPSAVRRVNDLASCRRFAAVPVGIFTASGQNPVRRCDSAKPIGVVWA